MNLDVPLKGDDIEIMAIGAAVFVLEDKYLKLNDEQKARVVEYLHQRYGAFNVAP